MQTVYALHSATKTYEAAKLQRIAAKTLSFRGVTKYCQDLRKKETDAKKTMDTLTDYFTDRQLKPLDNILWSLKGVNSRSIWKPDILHTLYQGMIKHMLRWLKLFLESHGRYAAWEAAWLRIPPFHGMPAPRKAIGQFKQQTGKLMRNAVKYLLPTLFIALKDPAKGKVEEFNRALTCVRYLVDFTLLAQYKIHTHDTIKLLDTYLEGFHCHKDVFTNFRTGKSVRAFAQSQ